MCDRNAKSENILIKLCARVFESICERTTKFHEKILFDSGVINLQTPTTKYLRFQYSVATAVTNARKWRCVLRTPSTFSRSVMVSVVVSSLGHTDLFVLFVIKQENQLSLTNRAMRGTSRSLCPPVTFVYCIQTAKGIVKPRPGSTIIVVFWRQAPIPNCKRNSIWGDKYTGMGNICDFRLKSPFISATVRDRPMVAVES